MVLGISIFARYPSHRKNRGRKTESVRENQSIVSIYSSAKNSIQNIVHVKLMSLILKDYFIKDYFMCEKC